MFGPLLFRLQLLVSLGPFCSGRISSRRATQPAVRFLLVLAALLRSPSFLRRDCSCDYFGLAEARIAGVNGARYTALDAQFMVDVFSTQIRRTMGCYGAALARRVVCLQVNCRRPQNPTVIWQSVLEKNPYEPPRDNSEVATPAAVEPWPDRQRKLFLLAAVPALFLPFSHVVVVASGILSGIPVHTVPASIGFLGLSGTAIQLPVYLVWALISRELTLKQKLIWG